MKATSTGSFLALAASGVLALAAQAVPASAAQPSFDCRRAEAGSIEETICNDDGLGMLDRQLAEVYRQAAAIARNQHPPVLTAEQRGWIKGRNECWKSEDERGCVQEAYRLRIAELEARYRLVEFTGPVSYACDGDARNEVIATFFRTEPPTLIAERGDQVSLMYLRRSASGSRYEGRNETLWAKGPEALVTWGYDAPRMRCVAKGPPE
jgi:uncharacterized protein